jgi:acyl-CoA synthetase (AMP-forming)/AMP-acid ligase II
MIAPLPGITTLKPGSATKPFPGIEADIVNEQGQSVPFGGGGYIVLRRPWPSMRRGIYGDPESYKQTYWSKFEHMYLAGDGCSRDVDGDYWFMGRIDDVMNVAGHRISTMEVENALVDHPQSPKPPSSENSTTLRVKRSAASCRYAARRGVHPRSRMSYANTSAKSSASSRRRNALHSRKSFPKRAAAKSCAGSYATSRKAERWGTRRRLPIRAWLPNFRNARAPKPAKKNDRDSEAR